MHVLVNPEVGLREEWTEVADELYFGCRQRRRGASQPRVAFVDGQCKSTDQMEDFCFIKWEIFASVDDRRLNHLSTARNFIFNFT